jgi:hypothetical protein
MIEKLQGKLRVFVLVFGLLAVGLTLCEKYSEGSEGHIHVHQLLLEYFLAFWVAVFAQMLVNWRREKRSGKE